MDGIVGRVLSVQSHVCHGYVGNRIITIAMQLLGIEVDEIHTVLYSNHTGYPHIKGAAMEGSQFRELCDGLHQNKLLDYDYVISGYTGSEDVLKELVNLVQTIKREYPNVRYICDPVLGDDGEYYTEKELKNIYLTSLIPLAYMITPNQFEVQELLGMKITCELDTIKALVSLMQLGPSVVAITSVHYPISSQSMSELQLSKRNSNENVILYCYIIERDETKPSEATITRYTVPKLPGWYAGTGDITTALLTTWTHIVRNQRQYILPDTDSAGVDDILLSITAKAIPYAQLVSTNYLKPDIWTLCPISADDNPISSTAFGYALASVQALLKSTSERVDRLSRLSAGRGFNLNSEEDQNTMKAYDSKIRELNVIGGRMHIINPPTDVLDDPFTIRVKL